MPRQTPIVWSIAGSDCGGGAGLQADLRTFHDLGVHGCTVVSAITAQNSLNVQQMAPLPAALVQSQLDALADDLPAAAIKIGMLGNEHNVRIVASWLQSRPTTIPVICDPVLSASSGFPLLDERGTRAMVKMLLPQVDLLTPNLAEARKLSELPLRHPQEWPQAAQKILGHGPKAVLITGGDQDEGSAHSADYFCDGHHELWLVSRRVRTSHGHGSGCSLSSAITAALALGHDLQDALVLAKAYLSQGLRQAQGLGAGPGPIARGGWPWQLEDYPGIHERWPAETTPIKHEFASCEKKLGLYAIVDSATWVKRLLALGVKTLQLRIKHLKGGQLETEISNAVALCHNQQARLFINDHWRLALRHKAYGVHLGQEDLAGAALGQIAKSGLRLGISTHSYLEIARAHAIRPSYIALGPIFATTSKPMPYPPRGLKQLADWVRLLGPHYPLVAIGGISQQLARPVLDTGVGSLAVISAICAADDPERATRQLLGQFNSPPKPSGPGEDSLIPDGEAQKLSGARAAG